MGRIFGFLPHGTAYTSRQTRNGNWEKVASCHVELAIRKHEDKIWLSTAGGSRAEEFYSRTGWRKSCTIANGEARFGMTYEKWLKNKIIKYNTREVSRLISEI